MAKKPEVKRRPVVPAFTVKSFEDDTENVLNKLLATETKSIYSVLSQGGTRKQLIEKVAALGDTAANYTATWVDTGLSVVGRKRLQEFGAGLGLNYYQYIGGILVKGTRDFCTVRSNGSLNKDNIFSQEEVESWPTGTEAPWDGMIAGTNSDNIFDYCGGWNCRHTLVPVLPPKSVAPPPAVIDEPPTPPTPPPAPPLETIVKPKPKSPKVSKTDVGLSFRDEKVLNTPLRDLTPAQKKFVRAQAVEQMDKAIASSGMTVEKTVISPDLSPARLEARVTQASKLFAEYDVKRGGKIKVEYKSTPGTYGVVKSWPGTPNIHSINFGSGMHKPSPANRISLDNIRMRAFKVKVDLANTDLYTVTHEFGHVIGVQQMGGDARAVGFFNDLAAIRREYVLEVTTLTSKGDTAGLEKIWISDYANKNLNEFMAEGFTEYKLNKTDPSPYSVKIGKLIDKTYKK